MSQDLLKEAREKIERALGSIGVIHVGPIDYNIFQTVDDLRAAERCLQEYGRQKANNA